MPSWSLGTRGETWPQWQSISFSQKRLGKVESGLFFFGKKHKTLRFDLLQVVGKKK